MKSRRDVGFVGFVMAVENLRKSEQDRHRSTKSEPTETERAMKQDDVLNRLRHRAKREAQSCLNIIPLGDQITRPSFAD